MAELFKFESPNEIMLRLVSPFSAMKLKKFFIYIMVACSSISCREHRTMRILRIQSCPEYPDLPVMITKMSKRHFSDDFYALNFSFIVKERIPVNLESYNTVNKCDLAGTPDSCEIYLKDFHVKNICSKINMKNQLWSASIETIKPPIRCPIQADEYELNFKGRCEFFKFFPLPNGVWKTKSILLCGHKMISCINIEVKVM